MQDFDQWIWNSNIIPVFFFFCFPLYFKYIVKSNLNLAEEKLFEKTIIKGRTLRPWNLQASQNQIGKKKKSFSWIGRSKQGQQELGGEITQAGGHEQIAWLGWLNRKCFLLWPANYQSELLRGHVLSFSNSLKMGVKLRFIGLKEERRLIKFCVGHMNE